MQTRPLIISDDLATIDALVRITAAAGTEALVVSDAGAARTAWPRASIVLVGAPDAKSTQFASLARRENVVLVTNDDTAESVWRDAVAIGAEHVVALPDGESWLLERLATWRESPTTPGRIVAVTGVCGGAGASTFTVALSCALARQGVSVLAVDGDRLGGGLDLSFGIEHAEGMHWPEFTEVSGRLSADALRTALPVAFGVSVLSWDRRFTAPLDAATLDSVLDAACRAYDVVLLDVPRGSPFEDWSREHVSDVVAVVPTRVRAVSAALQVLDRYASANVHVVARSIPPLEPTDLADALGRRLTAIVKDEQQLAKRADQGDPPGVGEREGISKAALEVIGELRISA